MTGEIQTDDAAILQTIREIGAQVMRRIPGGFLSSTQAPIKQGTRYSSLTGEDRALIDKKIDDNLVQPKMLERASKWDRETAGINVAEAIQTQREELSQPECLARLREHEAQRKAASLSPKADLQK
ncbi:MAG TPA: hypothetical protein VGO27_22435 [Candidatus Acidoferrum sp.]|nr:hypothetical protein [Candidatus Acidoferrum sp.]